MTILHNGSEWMIRVGRVTATASNRQDAWFIALALVAAEMRRAEA